MNAYKLSSSMNFTNIGDDINQIVQNIADHADDVLLATAPFKRSDFVNKFSKIVVQAEKNEKIDWLNITSRLHEWVANIPNTLDWSHHQVGKLEKLEKILSHDGQASDDKQQKFQLQKALKHCDQTLNVALKKWHWFGAFKDDPSLDLIYDEIERQRNLHLVGGDN